MAWVVSGRGELTGGGQEGWGGWRGCILNNDDELFQTYKVSP